MSLPNRTVDELLQLLSTPRPAGSKAAAQVYWQLKDWLEARGIAPREQTFRLYPWFWQGIGLWLIASRTLLVLAIWQGWGWWTLPIALIGLLGGLVDVAMDIPLASWFGASTGRNLLIEFDAPAPRRELILSAHYDTKTELLDHRQRMFFVRNLPVGIILTILLGIIGPLQAAAAVEAPRLAAALDWAGIALGLPLLVLAWGLGLNLALGRLRRTPSQGAVDNGAACAILLRLAEHYQRHPEALQHTRLILALFDGEEVNMQGSRAYVRSLQPLTAINQAAIEQELALPAVQYTQWEDGLPKLALNLEVMAQDGEYVIWEQDGISLKLWPNAPEVIQAVCTAVEAETGQTPYFAGPINSDGGSFVRAGIPAATLGTYDLKLRDRGFHQPSDNLERLVPERIPVGVRLLIRLIEGYEKR
jgi:hypothetical protein